MLVALDSDIRTGFDFFAVRDQDYSSANKAIRAEWAFWRKTAPKYRFGRTELMPVRSNSEGIGRYVGKYISKGIESRTEQFKGTRLVEYSRKAKIASTRFQFVTEGLLSGGVSWLSSFITSLITRAASHLLRSPPCFRCAVVLSLARIYFITHLTPVLFSQICNSASRCQIKI